MNKYTKISKELIEFIESATSSFQAVDTISEMLENAGYTRLEENDTWKLDNDGKYYVTRNASSLIAFNAKKEFEGFNIIASHGDSPAFKIKENPEMNIENKYTTINTEKYGGMIMSSWFDRPLSAAGRVLVKNAEGIQSVSLDFKRDLFLIPNLAIHMDRKVNDGYSYNPQKDMIPLFGMNGEKDMLDTLLSNELKIKKEDILSKDLFLYNRMPGIIWGADKEFLSAPRIDDLQCAFSSVKAISASDNENRINMCCIFDNEEVGSTTKQGADSTFLNDVLKRICISLDKSEEEFYTFLSDSFMVSADNAHAVHPNHTDKADPTNRPYLNGGVVLKQNANQKYTTDAVSQAVFKIICENAGVPDQTYVNRSDIAGGSTLGNISNTHISINTMDIGAPQLAMHSSYETTGIRDTEYLYEWMREFYFTSIKNKSNGYFIKKR